MNVEDFDWACDLAARIINTYLPEIPEIRTPVYCLGNCGEEYRAISWLQVRKPLVWGRPGPGEQEEFITCNRFPIDTTKSREQIAHEVAGAFLRYWMENQLSPNSYTLCTQQGEHHE